MNLLRKILLPFVPLYYFVTWIRNQLYDFGFKKSISYEFPVIAVGNLSVGGTGKSPMIEYLIRLLREKTRLATLSRGYKRETKGFQLADIRSTVKEIGDEPLQFKVKYTDVLVGVDSDRRNGIDRLRKQNPMPDVILLDDAYQHRKVKAGLYILLTAYYDLYSDDIMLPTGNLREPKSGAIRADIIVVTKCPKDITIQNQNEIVNKLNIQPNQQLFFSTIEYGQQLMNTSGKLSIDSLQQTPFVLVTGIANPSSLVSYYTSLGLNFNHIEYPDHYNFTKKDLESLQKHSLIITTEKDYMRLASDFSDQVLWYQPIEMKFIDQQMAFDTKIMEFVEC
ncbi:tetraacyldisaccharide 4'-kinase [Aquimarina addita]|uniref:Tetraacyldisaccharide 4'-kinase n=1 Tax=Aquimarina addita TaxID=870485 RepID=A0ABP7XCY6_9FLAO